MNIINTISILLFIYPVYKYNSYRALILLLNGLIFHGYMPNNKYMLYFDWTCCGIISFYSAYKAPHTFKIGFLFALLSIINTFSWRYKYQKNTNLCNFLHIFSTHLPYMILLCKIHKHQIKHNI